MSAANKAVQPGSCSGLLVVCTAICSLCSGIAGNRRSPQGDHRYFLRDYLDYLGNIYHAQGDHRFPLGNCSSTQGNHRDFLKDCSDYLGNIYYPQGNYPYYLGNNCSTQGDYCTDKGWIPLLMGIARLLLSLLVRSCNLYHPTAVNAVPPSWQEGKLGLRSIGFVHEIIFFARTFLLLRGGVRPDESGWEVVLLLRSRNRDGLLKKEDEQAT